NSATEMAESIKRFALNKEVMDAYGRRGRQMIEEDYSVKKVLEEKRSIYSEVIDRWEEPAWISH
ncbi:MAG TPA: glycosyltransferase family 1 protein, partial [Bacillales bacterium]|nr:glycosyltransferase family 1 protein [Bacillales bacterium]